ncbi:MAG: DUF1232 domain-containing protein [Bacteroides sp.]|nr:DUF1232 domain-containing protein [Bacteroides sp.]
MQETGITTTSTKGAWVWAILCGLYAISPIDIIPDVFPGSAGWTMPLQWWVADSTSSRQIWLKPTKRSQASSSL